MSIIRFAGERITGGRKGIIKPDAAGYYEQCIGGFNIKNAAGIIYSAEHGRKIFAEQGDLMRRLAKRNLRGEAGHPRRPPGMDDKAWFFRCMDIDETRTCVYWAEMALDEAYGRKNPDLGMPEMVGVIARFRPGGVMGDFLAKDMADGETNVCFSFRAFSKPFEANGQRYFAMQSLPTVDYVNEPGLEPATKMDSLTMESRDPTLFTSATIKSAMREVETGESMGLTMESAPIVRQLHTVMDLVYEAPKKAHFFTGWR